MSSQKSQSTSNFCFYASLLDAYQNFLDTDMIYEKYWGHSEDPKFTIDEYADKQFVELINRINRVPFTNDAVEKGTALNNMVDMLVDGVTDNDQYVIETDDEKQLIYIKEREIEVDEEGSPKEVFNKTFKFNLCFISQITLFITV